MTLSPHIAFIDPATHTPELDTFNRLTRSNNAPFSYHLPALFGMEARDLDPAKLMGIIVGGSSVHVSEKPTWQSDLSDWLMAQINRNIPVFGICYGHQLIADMYGAALARLPSKYSGWRKIHCVAEATLGLSESTENFLASHQEYVETIPDGFSVFASSQLIPIDGLRHTSLPIWSMQSHPEATDSFCRNQSIALGGGSYQPGWNLLEYFCRYCRAHFSHG